MPITGEGAMLSNNAASKNGGNANTDHVHDDTNVCFAHSH